VSSTVRPSRAPKLHVMSPMRRRAVVLALWLLAAPAAPAAAAPSAPPELPEQTQALNRAEPAALRAARAELRSAESALRRAERDRASLEERMSFLHRAATELRARVNELDVREKELVQRLQEARERLGQLAVASYVSGGSSTSVDYLLRARDPADLARRRKLVDSVGSVRNKAVKDYAAARQAASDQLHRTVTALDRLNAEGSASAAALDDANRRARRWSVELEASRQRLRLALAVTPVGGTDIPGLFVDAYRGAVAQIARTNGGCGLRWSALAAIGRIETNHGRSGDTRLTLKGDVLPRIVGIPLDGANGTAHVADTDGGLLDGDVVVDRAVGPMQVIPSTWKVVAGDGNDDGVTDPNNIFDAALAAAAYLCRAAPNGMRGDTDLLGAFFSYNHSTAYTDAALHWSKVYDSHRLPAGRVVL
jgi:membrane-bound lytic murein transglycosylase B